VAMTIGTGAQRRADHLDRVGPPQQHRDWQ
jgi:hypothetical protein